MQNGADTHILHGCQCKWGGQPISLRILTNTGPCVGSKSNWPNVVMITGPILLHVTRCQQARYAHRYSPSSIDGIPSFPFFCPIQTHHSSRHSCYSFGFFPSPSMSKMLAEQTSLLVSWLPSTWSRIGPETHSTGLYQQATRSGPLFML